MSSASNSTTLEDPATRPSQSLSKLPVNPQPPRHNATPFGVSASENRPRPNPRISQAPIGRRTVTSRPSERPGVARKSEAGSRASTQTPIGIGARWASIKRGTMRASAGPGSQADAIGKAAQMIAAAAKEKKEAEPVDPRKSKIAGLQANLGRRSNARGLTAFGASPSALFGSSPSVNRRRQSLELLRSPTIMSQRISADLGAEDLSTLEDEDFAAQQSRTSQAPSLASTPLKGRGGRAGIFEGTQFMNHNYRLYVALLISDPRFEGFFAIIVFVNAIIMALESEMLEKKKTFQIIDNYLLVGYTVELFLRWFALRSMVLRGAANILDIVIISTGWLSFIMDNLAAGGALGGKLDALNALKVLRALRVLRCVRMLTFFDGLWFIVQSFWFCMKPLGHVCIFVFIMLFVFAIFTVEMIGTSDNFAGAENQELFSRTIVAFVTLFQLMTLDEWRLLIQPLCDKQPWAYFFFFFFIACAALATMNLVTAVVVESSIKRIQDDEEHKATQAQKERLIEKERCQNLLACFSQDEDDEDVLNTIIQPEELLNARGTWHFLRTILSKLELHHAEDIFRLFQLLDADGNGQLSLTEVLDGILQLRSLTEDKYKIALLRAFKTGRAKFLTMERFCEQLPEASGHRLDLLEEQIEMIEMLLNLPGNVEIVVDDMLERFGESFVETLLVKIRSSKTSAAREVRSTVYSREHELTASQTLESLGMASIAEGSSRSGTGDLGAQSTTSVAASEGLGTSSQGFKKVRSEKGKGRKRSIHRTNSTNSQSETMASPTHKLASPRSPKGSPRSPKGSRPLRASRINEKSKALRVTLQEVDESTSPCGIGSTSSENWCSPRMTFQKSKSEVESLEKHLEQQFLQELQAVRGDMKKGLDRQDVSLQEHGQRLQECHMVTKICRSAITGDPSNLIDEALAITSSRPGTATNRPASSGSLEFLQELDLESELSIESI